MSAGMYGADPEQLDSLGQQLQAQNEAIAGIRGVVLSALGGTTWQGPAREKFGTQWNDQFNPALMRMEEAFTAVGAECRSRALSLAQVMGAGGGS
jgi:uncharacterized protein YukE